MGLECTSMELLGQGMGAVCSKVLELEKDKNKRSEDFPVEQSESHKTCSSSPQALTHSDICSKHSVSLLFICLTLCGVCTYTSSAAC